MKTKAGSTLIRARRKPTGAVCSGWSYPIQAEFTLVLGGVPPLARVWRVDGEVGASLVCIDSVLSLAVVSAALQKLHKCVTQNTTELLQDTRAEETRGRQRQQPGPASTAGRWSTGLDGGRRAHLFTPTAGTCCPDPPPQPPVRYGYWVPSRNWIRSGIPVRGVVSESAQLWRKNGLEMTKGEPPSAGMGRELP